MSGAFNIDSLLEDVVTLPSLPDTIVRLMSLVDDPECKLSEVAKVISADPALTLKTLRLVNSAYYGLGKQVGTVEHAVVMLGVRVVKNLALTATVFETLQTGATAFLRHSVACGVAMRAIVDSGKTRAGAAVTGDEAFIFGLLHDVGKVVLEKYLPEQWREAGERVRTERIPWHQAERAVIGVDHAQVGGRLAQNWKLAPTLAEAIDGHHDLDRPAGDDVRVLAAALAVADFLCAASGLPSHDNPVYDLPDRAWTCAGLAADDVSAVTAEFFSNYHMAGKLMTMAG